MGENHVAIIYAIASIVTIFGLMEMPKFTSRYGNRNCSIFSVIVSFISLLILSFSNTGILIIPAFILYFASSNILIANLDIFLEESSNNSNVGKVRGFYLTIVGLAWVIAQMVSGSIISKSSFGGIYLFSGGLMILSLLVLFLFFGNFKDSVYKKISILKTIKFFKKDKNLLKIYLINLILKFFFAWMVIYTPIYLNEYLHFTWDKLGIIFTIMLLPFVILDFPLGKLSDKIGEKKMLILGFTIATLFTTFFGIIKTNDLIIVALILFGTRIGAATIEVMSEVYFFKEIGPENGDEISFFRNTFPIAYLLATLLAIPTIVFIPSFEFIFYILAAIMLFGLFLSLRIKDLK